MHRRDAIDFIKNILIVIMIVLLSFAALVVIHLYANWIQYHSFVSPVK